MLYAQLFLTPLVPNIKYLEAFRWWGKCPWFIPELLVENVTKTLSPPELMKWCLLKLQTKILMKEELQWLISVVIHQHHKHLLKRGNGNASNRWVRPLFLSYWFRLMGCKAMEKRATAAHGGWRIADMPDRRPIRSRLCLSLTTVGGDGLRSCHISLGSRARDSRAVE